MRLKIIAAIIREFVLAGAIARVTAQVPPLIAVKDIEILGNTVFESELEAIVAPLEGREIPLEQILELRDQLTEYYLERGYASSGAFLPPQKLTDGQSRITALHFGQEYVKNGASTLLAVSSQFNVGFDAFDATKTEVGIDGLFWSWQGDFQYLKALNEKRDAVLATRIITQLTPHRLLPVEQFTMGGLGSVRGYRPNLGVADNGVVGTIELQLPLIRGEKWGEIKIIPFFDVGAIWNNGREITGTTNTFASSGLGLRYRLRDVFEARADYGIPLIDPKGFGATDTEDRFSFSLLVRPLRF